jgi:hypothetical protein
MKNIYEHIVNILSISISSEHIEEILKNNPESIFLHRHPIFLVKSFLLNICWLILIYIYIWLVYSLGSFVFSQILAGIWWLFFISRIRISFKNYFKYSRHKKTIYTNSNSNEIIDTYRITSYIWKWIILCTLLGIDILITIWVQIIIYWLSWNTWVYIIELIIMILLCVVIMKCIKIQLDFEMDHFIVTRWWIIVTDREWLYWVENKMYIWSQIQTIEVIQSWRTDAFLKLWTVRIHTWSSISQSNTKILTFWKIYYTPSIEAKLRSVIYS